MSTTRSASELFRSECSRVWTALHRHPFITELAEGTLPLDKFRFFLEQDTFFLEEYGRCLALGAAKSSSEQELRYFIVDLNQVLDAEIPSNRQLLAKVIELGAEERGGSLTMAPANIGYSGYIQALALRGGTLQIMASLLPCSWSYVEIATSLRGSTDDTHPVYADWIGYFSRLDVVEMVGEMRTDFDELVARQANGDAQMRELSSIFTTSSRLERAFWDMAYRLEQWPDLGNSGVPDVARIEPRSTP